jgi:hypothetical protein
MSVYRLSNATITKIKHEKFKTKKKKSQFTGSLYRLLELNLYPGEEGLIKLFIYKSLFYENYTWLFIVVNMQFDIEWKL